MKLIFEKEGTKIEVYINGHNLFFSDGTTQMTTMEGLKFDYGGVIKEFPDLKDEKNWRIEAVKRFKEKIKVLETEKDVAKYVVNDLQKHQYKLISAQKEGFRAGKTL